MKFIVPEKLIENFTKAIENIDIKKTVKKTVSIIAIAAILSNSLIPVTAQARGHAHHHHTHVHFKMKKLKFPHFNKNFHESITLKSNKGNYWFNYWLFFHPHHHHKQITIEDNIIPNELLKKINRYAKQGIFTHLNDLEYLEIDGMKDKDIKTVVENSALFKYFTINKTNIKLNIEEQQIGNLQQMLKEIDNSGLSAKIKNELKELVKLENQLISKYLLYSKLNVIHDVNKINLEFLDQNNKKIIEMKKIDHSISKELLSNIYNIEKLINVTINKHKNDLHLQNLMKMRESNLKTAMKIDTMNAILGKILISVEKSHLFKPNEYYFTNLVKLYDPDLSQFSSRVYTSINQYNQKVSKFNNLDNYIQSTSKIADNYKNDIDPSIWHKIGTLF